MSEMICTCQAEGVREVEARRLRIFKRMGLDDISDLTTAIILSLAFDFQADASIAADMWFGVYLDTPLIKDTPSAARGLSIECDWPHDGLAFLWEQLAEKFPERVSVKQGTSATAIRVTERISAAMLSNYEEDEAAYRKHREEAHNGPNDCPPCEDCSVLLTLRTISHHALDEVWGSGVLDRAIEKAWD
jgi:hypothetical protein